MRSNEMANRSGGRAASLGLLALAALTIGCEQQTSSPTALIPSPSAAPPATSLSVTAITPNRGSTAAPVPVTITGTGFLAGATVTLGVAATGVVVVNGTTIMASAPAHDAGTVDVVVTSPAGQSGRLPGAFTYVVAQPYTLTSSANTVVAGAQLSVSWTAPRGGEFDWLGLFKVGDPSTNYESGWWQYTDGAVSGTVTLNAPTTPGQYEFRYLLDDGYVDAVRSTPVTVTPG